MSAGITGWLAPGTDAAIMYGCICPPLDNAHGLGVMGLATNWVIVAGCPLHTPSGYVTPTPPTPPTREGDDDGR